MNKNLVATLVVSLFLAVPAATASWASYGDGVPEPNTAFDLAKYNFQTPNQAPTDKVYLNAYFGYFPAGAVTNDVLKGSRIHPVQSGWWLAWFGMWRDCNADGYIGDGATGFAEYEAALLGRTDICPDGSAYNADGLVTEFRWIGPGASDTGSTTGVTPIDLQGGFARDVSDEDAIVWGDWNLPTQAPAATVGVFPLPSGTLDNMGNTAKWANLLSGGLLANNVPDWQTHVSNLQSVPNPLGTVRDRFNDSKVSEGAGAHGTPLVTVWNCDKPNEGPGGATPGIEPTPNLEKGALDPTLAHVTRTALPDPTTGDPGGYCFDDGAHFPYSNLETPGQNAVSAAGKDASDHPMVFISNARISDQATGALDQRELFLGVGSSTPRAAAAGALWQSTTFWLFGATADPPWSAIPRGIRTTLYATFYAHTSLTETGEIGCSALPNGCDAFTYGSENCNGLTPITGTWVCDPAAWIANESPNVVGDPYELRDTDCYDEQLQPGVKAHLPKDLAPDKISAVCAE